MNYTIKDAVTLDDVVNVARKRIKVEISPEAIARIKKSRENVEKLLTSDKVMYGINTGFGALANVKISQEDIDDLQSNLVRSHSVGVGDILSNETTRAMMFLRAISLSRGYSGVRVETVKQIIEFLNRGITPIVPSQGSVGSSGDLAPLAHVALAMMGEGDVIYQGKITSASRALEMEGLKPLKYSAKEGLALTNGTQAMTAVLALTLYDAKILFENALMIASISIDALKGSTTPFEPRIHELRPYDGQRYVAQKIMEYLSGSEIRASHINCSKVQDAYSLRAIPQVLGAVKDTIDYAEKQVLIEMNSVTDNPLVFDGEVLSGGNFHGEPMAFVADFLGISLSELGNIAERRIDRLVNPLVSNLPPFLADGKSGLNSGLMMWQYTAASLVSENKVLAHPASVDSIPTSAYQEDHVSMGTIAAIKGRKIFENVSKIVAIEAMLGSKAVRYHLPLKTGKKIEPVVDLINSKVNYVQKDHYMGKEFEEILMIVKSESLRGMIE